MINNALSINPNKTKHLGPLFHTIDFKCHKHSKAFMEQTGDTFSAGALWVGGRQYGVTYKQLLYSIETHDISYLGLPTITAKESDRIIETFEQAKRVFWQKYGLNV